MKHNPGMLRVLLLAVLLGLALGFGVSAMLNRAIAERAAHGWGETR